MRKYHVLQQGSRLNYDLNLEEVHTLEGIRKTLQSILDDLPKPEIDSEIQVYMNEEGLNIILEEDVHIE